MRNDLTQPVRYYPDVPQMGVANDSPPVTGDDSSPGVFANLVATLNIGFGKVVSELRKNRERMNPPLAPVFGRFFQPIQLSATGFGVARLTGPDQGHYWYVRSLTVAGNNDPSAVTPGRADVFVSAADLRTQTSLAQIGLADWRDMATALPNVGSYSKGELALRFNEELYVVVSAGTANAIYFAGCSFEDFQESNNAQDWDL